MKEAVVLGGLGNAPFMGKGYNVRQTQKPKGTATVIDLIFLKYYFR